jgi:hypothetical protein
MLSATAMVADGALDTVGSDGGHLIDLISSGKKAKVKVWADGWSDAAAQSVGTQGLAPLNEPPPNPTSDAAGVLKQGVLTVTDTDGVDDLRFSQVDGMVSVSGVSGIFTASKVKSIAVWLQDGDDGVSLDSLSNDGNQALAKLVTIYSGAGSQTVRLADGHDVVLDGVGHTLKVTADGVATLDGEAISWDDPDPDPVNNWFTTNVQDAALSALGSSLYIDGLIDRGDVIALLQNAGDDDVVDATELADLQQIVNNSTLFGTLGYVERLTEYVVLGSNANGMYQGQILGNLAAGSSTAQLTNLVNKWFLGLDRPTASGTYRQIAGQLFVDGPSNTDVRQGQVGDCYLVASLAEAALVDPAIITSMFIVNGDGTYTVTFYNYGQAEYVTVDSFLSTNGSGNLIYASRGQHYLDAGNELWVALAEKAYVQANQFGWIRPGLPGNGQNAYSAIDGGYIATALGHVSGQTTIAFASASTAANFTTMVNAFDAGELVAFASKSTTAPGSGIVGAHAYAVVGYDLTAQTVTLYNPWGPEYGLLTLTWAEIGESFSYFDRTA